LELIAWKFIFKRKVWTLQGKGGS